MKLITASAPGKILLLGGYSVLEKGNIAYSLTVDAFAHATIKQRKDTKIIIKSPQLKIKIETDLKKIEKQKTDEKNKFIISSINTVLKYLKFRKRVSSGFEINTKSDEPFSIKNGKSGLGSSAAVTVATIAALFKTFGTGHVKNLEEIHKVSQISHSLAQNKIGSGFDVASACYGSVLYSRYDKEILNLENIEKTFAKNLDCIVEKMPFLSKFELVMASFPKDSMSSVSATAKVIEFKKKNNEKYSELIRDLNIQNELTIIAMEKNNLQQFKEHWEKARWLTKKLGVLAKVEIENNEHTKLIQETKKNGAFVAKLPGAGGGDSIIALCLNKKSAEKVKKFWKKKKLNLLDIKVQNEGVKIS